MSNSELISDKAKEIITEIAKELVAKELANNASPPLPAKYLGGLLDGICDWAAEVTVEPKEPQDDQTRRQLVGNRIKRVRQALNLKQADVAKKLGVSTALVTAYETGRREPSIKNLVALTKILNVSADWLLGLS